MKLLLANIDYRPGPGCGHMTSEGHEFQAGLEHAGWKLVGAGFDDGCRLVPLLLLRHKPSMVVVHDKRDWHPESGIAFRNDIAFEQLEALREFDGFKAVVVKDAGNPPAFQSEFCEQVRPDTVITYYHELAVGGAGPWLSAFHQTRTYHSVDREICDAIAIDGPRERGIVSGAVSRAVYPTRWTAKRFAGNLGVRVHAHPGYGNKGCHTPEYLKTLAGYRVHVATASRFGFALRKIIESVAMGCTPVTDLPAYDVLPEIDGALIRIPHGASWQTIKAAVDRADDEWNLEERAAWAEKARAFYDWRAIGTRLDGLLEAAFSDKSDAKHWGLDVAGVL